MSRTASATSVTQTVSKQAARQREPQRHEGLIAKFVHALAGRLSRAAGEDRDTPGRRGVLPWLKRHSVLYAWIVVLLVYAEFVGFADWGGELAGVLLVAAAAWWFAVGKPSVVASTARHLSVLVLTGLTILFLALCALNTFFSSVRPATVHSVQESLARFRLQLSDWTSFSLAPLLIVGTGLLVLAVTWTNLDAARRYKHVQSALGSYQALLLVLCSFVIYAQSPLQHDVRVTYDRLAHAYRAAVEQQIKAQSQIAAAPQMRQSLQDLSHNQQQHLGSVLHTIYSDAHGDRYAVSLVESQVFDPRPLLTSAGIPADMVHTPVAPRTDLGQMLDGNASAAASTSVGPLPATPKQLDEEIDVASAAEAAASRVSPAAHQAASAVISMLVRIAEFATPLHIPSAAAQMVAENLFENYVDLFEPKVARTLNDLGVGRGHAPRLDAKSFLHQGLSASPEAIAHATPPPGVADALHASLAPHSDPSDPHPAPSDAPDSVGVLDDLHF